MKSGAIRVGNLVRKIAARVKLELIFWCAALAAPLFINPYEKMSLDFCLFHSLGIDFCPGCGLGRALALLYRGDLTASFMTHPLAVFFVFVICFRIMALFNKSVENSNHRIGVNHV